MPAPVLASLVPSPPRRAVGVLLPAVVAGTLVWAAFVGAQNAHYWRLFLLVPAGLLLWLAVAMRRATRQRLELTAEVLREASGEVIVRIDLVKAVDRGAFAFRPSGGFLLKLSEPQPAAWRPGLWWRFGRRVGIGGVTSQAEGKFMADVLAMRLAEGGR